MKKLIITTLAIAALVAIAGTKQAIYAPVVSGTSGQLLKSNGPETAPTWTDSVNVNAFDLLYPVGTVYISATTNLPAIFTADGRTWERLSDGQFLMNTTGDTGGTGGANSITLSVANLPSHYHGVDLTSTTSGAHTHTHNGYKNCCQDSKNAMCLSYGTISSDPEAYGGEKSGSHTHSVRGNLGNTGSGTAFDNRPSYLAVSMWKRTS